MFFKVGLLFCAQALLIKGVFAQCAFGAPLGATPYAGAWGAPWAAEWDYAPAALSASNGPGVAVATASPLIPAGVSILSENAYEGPLAVEGALPFLGTVAFEGALPTAGAGVVAYSCGNGVVGITAEEGIGIAGGYGAGPLAGPLAAGPLAVGPLAGALAGPLAGAPFAEAWGPYAAEQAYVPAAALSASNGPGLAVSSVSPQYPAGVSVQSENAYEGGLAVGGAVPFLGTVALEGAVPTAGAGAVAYGCGNGAVAITAEEARGGIGSAWNGGRLGVSGIGRTGWGCGI